MAQLAPPSNGGIVELDRLLQRIAENRRVLIIAAHPDDEDTALLALMARGYGVDAAYLSLCRGEGGQNLIGSELGPALGLLRSQELVAARSLDGARQFFTRAYDFGYSRSIEETSRLWLPDSILKDVVRIVRRWRPHIVLSIFSGTPRDRHGQHRLAGVLAHRAFDVAGDPSVYPELESEEGLTAWEPLKLYRSTRFDPDATTLELETGMLDPGSGRSFHQIAMESRSRHRSQDMGRLQRIGPGRTRMQLVASRADADGTGFFDGIAPELSWIARFADSLRSTLSPRTAGDAARPLARALRTGTDDDLRPSDRVLMGEALGVAAGLVIDALAADDEVVPGQQLEVSVEVYSAGRFEIRIDSISIEAPDSWVVIRDSGGLTTITQGQSSVAGFTVTVPRTASPTQPYFLTRPLIGSLYDWTEVDADVIGLPFQPPLLRARAFVSVLGASITLSREVTYRYNDQATGEVRREVRVVPEIEVKLEPEILVWPAEGQKEREFTVTLAYNGSEQTSGTVALEPDGWPAPAKQQFGFEQHGESRTFSFHLGRPADVHVASINVRAVARTSAGKEYDTGIDLVEYTHVRPTAMIRRAVSEVRVAPIRLPSVAGVGYVRGAADQVPEALLGVGLPVVVLEGEHLARGDLSVFDAIIIGSRAYETDSALTRHNDRLLDYVRGGGLLLVQYQQYAFVRGGYSPYPIRIAFPHDRVADESAPVKLIDVNHPVFGRPNPIRAEDWDGWPQERGLYFAHDWDDAYQALIETGDPDHEVLRGGLLIASYGAGTYIYTGLSFFRALPAGVPGAFKLFLNLVGLEPQLVR